MPSLPVFVAIGLLVVFLVASSLTTAGPAFTNTVMFTVQVADQNAHAVDGATISITKDGAQIAAGTADSSGLFSPDLEPGTYMLSVSAANCESAEQEITVSEDMEKTIAVELQCEATGAALVSLCFTPGGVGTVNALVYEVSGAEARYDRKVSDCGLDKCELVAEPGYKYKFEARGYVSELFYSADALFDASNRMECIPLTARAEEAPANMGVVTVIVSQTDGTLLPGLTVKLVNPDDNATAIENGIGHTGYSGPSLGRVSFDLREGTQFRVLVPAGENSSYYLSNETYNVTEEPLEINIVLNISAKTTFITQEKVAGVTKPLPGTEVAVFNSLDTFVGSGLTKAPDAELVIGLNKDETYRATFFKPEYRYTEREVVGGSDDNVVVLEKIAAEQVGGIDVYVMFKETQTPIAGATLTLVDKNNSKRTGYGMPITNDDGYASFDWVLPGDYCIIVSRGEGEPSRCDDNPVTVVANERVEMNIELEPNNFKLRVDVLTQNGSAVWKADVTLLDTFDDSTLGSSQTLRDGHVTFDVSESTTVQARVDYKAPDGAVFKQISEPVFMDKNRAIKMVLVPVDNKVRFIGFEQETRGGDSSALWMPYTDLTGWGRLGPDGQGWGAAAGFEGDEPQTGFAQHTSSDSDNQLVAGGLFFAVGDKPKMAAGRTFKAKFTLGLKNPVAGSEELWESVVQDILDDIRVAGEYPLEFYPIATFEGASVSEGLPSNAETLTLSGNYENAGMTIQVTVPVRVRQVFNGSVDHFFKYKAQWTKGDHVIRDPKTGWYSTSNFSIQAGHCRKYGDLGVCKYVSAGSSQVDPSTYTGQLNTYITLGLEITNEGNSDFDGSAKLTDALSVLNFQQTTSVSKIDAADKSTSLVKNRDYFIAPQEITVVANEYTSLKHGERLVVTAAGYAVSPVKRTSIKATAGDSDVGVYAFKIDGTVEAMVSLAPEGLYDLTPSVRFNITEKTLVGGETVAGKLLDVTAGEIKAGSKGYGISCAIPDILNDGRMAGGTGHVTRGADGSFTLTLDRSCRLLTTAKDELTFTAKGDFFRDIAEKKGVGACLETPALAEREVTATLKCPIQVAFSKDFEATEFDESAPDCSLGAQAKLNVKIAEGCPMPDSVPSMKDVKYKAAEVKNCADGYCKTGGDSKTVVWFNYTKALDSGVVKMITLNIPVNATSANDKILSTYKLSVPLKVSTKECVEGLEYPETLEVAPKTKCTLKINYGTTEAGYSDSDCSDGAATLNLLTKEGCGAGVVINKPTMGVTDASGVRCPGEFGKSDQFCKYSVKDKNTVTFEYTSSEAFSQANPSKDFTLALTVSTKGPDSSKTLNLPLKVKIKQCLVVRKASELETPIVQPRKGCTINVQFVKGSSGYSDADCSDGEAWLDIGLNERECSGISADKASLDTLGTVLDANGNECGISKYCSLKFDGNTLTFDYTTKTKPANPSFTIRTKVFTTTPAGEYDLELPVLIGTRASLSRPPFQGLRIQKYSEPYDCTLNWCAPEQLLKYVGDASRDYTTSSVPVGSVRMVDVTLTSDNVINIMKSLYPTYRDADLIKAYASVGQAQRAQNLPMPDKSKNQNLVIFNSNKLPKLGENSVTITKGFLDLEKNYPYLFISFEPVQPSAETQSRIATAKGIQLYLPASKGIRARVLETESTWREGGADADGLMNKMWGMTDWSGLSGDHKLKFELCEEAADEACKKLVERTGSEDLSISAIYREVGADGTSTVHFVAENADRMERLVDAFKDTLDGKTSLEVRNIEKDGGYLTELSENMLRVYAVTKDKDGETYTNSLLSDSAVRNELRDAVAGYSGIAEDRKSLISFTALTEDDLSDPDYEYGPEVVIVTCMELDECLKKEADDTTDNYYASDVLPEFKKEFGSNAKITDGIYFVKERIYSGQGAVKVHYIFSKTKAQMDALLKTMAGSGPEPQQFGTVTIVTKRIDTETTTYAVIGVETDASTYYYAMMTNDVCDFSGTWVVSDAKKCKVTSAGRAHIYDTLGTVPAALYPGSTYFVTSTPCQSGGNKHYYIKPLGEKKDDALPVCPYYQELLSENFDDAEQCALGGRGWGCTVGPEGSVLSAEATSGMNGKASRLKAPSNKAGYAYQIGPTTKLDYTKDYAVSFKLKPVGKSQNRFEVFTNRHAYFMLRGTTIGIYLKCFEATAVGNADKLITRQLTDGQVYSVELKVNPATSNFDIYIDSAKVDTCKFHSLGTSQLGMDKFRMGDLETGKEHYGEAYWDDFKIMGYNTP